MRVTRRAHRVYHGLKLLQQPHEACSLERACFEAGDDSVGVSEFNLEVLHRLLQVEDLVRKVCHPLDHLIRVFHVPLDAPFAVLRLVHERALDQPTEGVEVLGNQHGLIGADLTPRLLVGAESALKCDGDRIARGGVVGFVPDRARDREATVVRGEPCEVADLLEDSHHGIVEVNPEAPDTSPVVDCRPKED